MSKALLNKHLKELNIEELKYEIMGLYGKLPGVREHYVLELGSEQARKRIYTRIKKDITSKYATRSRRRPRNPRIQKINGIISKIEKAIIFKFELVDIYLHDVECALQFVVHHYYYSSVLYNHIYTIFQKAVILIQEEQVHDMYKDRCQLILDRSTVMMEIHLDLNKLFNQCFD